MIMDVDMHSSPPFRTARTPSGSCKRPRSPTSPSPLDRPAKRISSGARTPVSLPLAQLGVASAPPPRTRQVSGDDWVTQTRGLRIESSPIVDQNMFPSTIPEEDGMTMDTFDPLPSGGTPSPCPPNSPEHMMHSPPESSSSYQIARDVHIPPQSAFLSYHGTSASVSHFTPFDITFHGSSPIDAPIMQRLSTPEPHTIALPQTPVTTRKPRFTMGPRTDCEKCRNGVKGHWVHLD